jgi:hypothetical protein
MTVNAAKDDLTEARKHLERAYTHEEGGQLEKALRQCELAIELAPNLADSHNLRGIVLEQLGRKEQAIVAYNEAIRLKPDFEEAKENLYEAQDETRRFQRVLAQKQAWKIALYGALGYGISFAVVGAVSAVLRAQTVTQIKSGVQVSSPKYNFYQLLVLTALLYALGSGISAAILGKASGSEKVKLLLVMGALGFGTAYSVTSVAHRVLVPFFIFRSASIDTVYTVATTVQFAITGAVTGVLIGLIQRDIERLVWLSLAGAAFGLDGLSSSLLWHLVLSISYSGLVPGSFGDITHDSIVFAITWAIQGLLVGGIGGALLGLVVGWPKLGNDQQIRAD